MTFLHVTRRTHLYLGLFLLPWLVMYGASSYPINHNRPIQATFTRFFEGPFQAPVPEATADLHGLGRQMMDAARVNGGFYVSRPNPGQVNVNHPNFLHPVRIFYYLDEHRMVAEQRDFMPRLFLTGLHTRGGYGLGGTWDDAWAVFVDLLSVGLLVWIASGLWMWWTLPNARVRRWGWLALGAGVASFAMIMATL